MGPCSRAGSLPPSLGATEGAGVLGRGGARYLWLRNGDALGSGCGRVRWRRERKRGDGGGFVQRRGLRRKGDNHRYPRGMNHHHPAVRQMRTSEEEMFPKAKSIDQASQQDRRRARSF